MECWHHIWKYIAQYSARLKFISKCSTLKWFYCNDKQKSFLYVWRRFRNFQAELYVLLLYRDQTSNNFLMKCYLPSRKPSQIMPSTRSPCRTLETIKFRTEGICNKPYIQLKTNLIWISHIKISLIQILMCSYQVWSIWDPTK